jgi:hypothetical protein
MKLTLDPKDACDVYLSHAGEQKKTFVDCLFQLLECSAGVKGKRQRLLKVFLDQHSLTIGDRFTPWEVMEYEARHCSIGEHVRRLANVVAGVEHAVPQ